MNIKGASRPAGIHRRDINASMRGECDTQRTTFPSFENRNNFDICYIPPNLIPRFQSQVFFVQDEAAIQPVAQEMHFENVNKEGGGEK